MGDHSLGDYDVGVKLLWQTDSRHSVPGPLSHEPNVGYPPGLARKRTGGKPPKLSYPEVKIFASNPFH
jgi:hypothetical protein